MSQRDVGFKHRCNVEGCPQHGKNMWLASERALAVKGSEGRQTVTVYLLRCAVQKPYRLVHTEYVGPHGESLERMAARGRFRFTDSTTGQLIETESSHARAMGDPKKREKMSKAGKRAWRENREARVQKIRIGNADPVRRAKIGAATKRRYADPAEREKMRDHANRTWADPKIASRRIRGTRRAMADPEWREHCTAGIKRAWSERKAKEAARWRPADWNEKPIEWRIIGTELCSGNHLTNETLARRLDDSRIIKCPYGETWEEASVTSPACLKFLNRIRGWVKKPGRIASQK